MAYDVGKLRLAFDCGALGTRVMISFTVLMSVKETYWKLWRLVAVILIVHCVDENEERPGSKRGIY